MSVAGSQMQGLALAASLSEEKRARRLAEDDALRLYNRIRQLQKEEERADRRIKETKQKAASIQEQQQRQLERIAEKQAREAAAKEQLDRVKQENCKLKQEHERIRQQVEARLLAEKASCAAATKEQRAELQAELEVLQASRLAAVVAKKEAVKQKQLTGTAKVQQHRAAKQVMAQAEYERRLKEELEVKASKEQEIAELAQLELQLIERLKLKQQKQYEAARQLESALALRQSIRCSQQETQQQQQRPRNSARASRPDTAASNGSCAATRSSSSSSSRQQARDTEADEAVARAFAKYDSDATGLIRTQALAGLLHDLGMPLTDEQLEMAVAQLDAQHTGAISFGQFLLWWRE